MAKTIWVCMKEFEFEGPLHTFLVEEKVDALQWLHDCYHDKAAQVSSNMEPTPKGGYEFRTHTNMIYSIQEWPVYSERPEVV